MPIPPDDSDFELDMRDTETGRWWIPLLFALLVAAWYVYQAYEVGRRQPVVIHNLANCPSDYYVGIDGNGNMICVPPPKGT